MPTSKSDQQETPRRIIGRYRLDHVLGRGAMGTVWAGYDEMLHRPVAVKEVLFPPGMPEAEADALRERTLREARAIAVLTHPNVVTLFDVAREDGEPFVVMELLLARSLAELIREYGPLEAGQAAAVGDAIAAGLEAAHRAGITHRDVKPGNVLVANDGQIKLTDFGIARNVSEATMTSAGLMLGSPAFIAPEVASGDPATPAADLWGLGATLFAAMEGRPPYDADDALATVLQVVQGEVPVPEDAGALSPVITGLMVKDPTLRMSLGEVRRRLHSLLLEPGAQLFPAGDFPDGDSAGIPALAAEESGAGAVVVARNTLTNSAPLAVDPGPLPFLPPAGSTTAWPARWPRFGWLGRVAAVVFAVLLFAGGAAGGFGLTRMVAGRPLVPERLIEVQAGPPAPLRELKPREDSAAIGKGEVGGTFGIAVPKDWTSFREQRSVPKLPTSMAVRYVSPDGRQQVMVERFANFYPKYAVKDYVATLPELTTGPSGKYLLAGLIQANRIEVGTPEASHDLIYRTVVRAHSGTGSSELTRTTFARLLPRGDDLWVIQVTVPNEQEDAGRRTLFDKMVPGFSVLS